MRADFSKGLGSCPIEGSDGTGVSQAPTLSVELEG